MMMLGGGGSSSLCTRSNHKQNQPNKTNATAKEMGELFARASNEARAAFGDGRMFVEKYVEDPRHIEIQVAVCLCLFVCVCCCCCVWAAFSVYAF